MSAFDPVGFIEQVSFSYVIVMGFVAMVCGLTIGMVFRAYIDERVPWPVPLIVGVGIIGLWTNTASALVQFVESTNAAEPLFLQNVETNATALVAGGAAALGGARVGDRAAPNLRALTGARKLNTDVNRIVRTVGRFITVKMPGAKKVEDIEGYEPIPEETKEQFAGIELVFPRGLTLEELRERITTRLREDYGVGQVDLELTEDGKIDSLAVGSRASGIGPTLPPRKVAIAVRADPADAASPGDRVHLWAKPDEDASGAERVAVGELRAADDDIATAIIDANRARAIDQSTEYHLVTLHARKQPEKEFAALLRAANETMESVTVTEGGDLVDLPVGALRPTVVAIRSASAPLDTLPPREYTIAVGDTLYAIGRPDELRKLQRFVSPPDPESASASEDSTTPERTKGIRDRVRSLTHRAGLRRGR